MPAPKETNLALELTSGSLGSAGALLAVSARGQKEACRSVWRFRGRRLESLPIHAGGAALRACAPHAEWSYRWERKEDDAPAVYVRERTRTTPQGLHRSLQAFAFSGFRLDLDPARSLEEIDGVRIPDWQNPSLYAAKAAQAVTERFDLSVVRSMPQLKIETDGARGLFALHLRDAAGGLTTFVEKLEEDKAKGRVRLQLRGPEVTGQAVVEVSSSRIPFEARLSGFGARFDQLYRTIRRLRDGAIQVYPTAEDELAMEGLSGTWTGDRGERFEIAAVPGGPGRIRFGSEVVSLRLEDAPTGTDLLLMPADGSPPTWALDLRGPYSLARVPVRCLQDLRGCERAGPGVILRKSGARVNLP